MISYLNKPVSMWILRSTFSGGKIHFLNFPLHLYLVYANNEERIKGGGCLELRKYVEIELGLDPGSITGDWDFSHKLQLIWGDTLKKNPWIFNTIKQYFATMKSMNIGKSSTQFFETAAELDNLPTLMSWINGYTRLIPYDTNKRVYPFIQDIRYLNRKIFLKLVFCFFKSQFSDWLQNTKVRFF